MNFSTIPATTASIFSEISEGLWVVRPTRTAVVAAGERCTWAQERVRSISLATCCGGATDSLESEFLGCGGPEEVADFFGL